MAESSLNEQAGKRQKAKGKRQKAGIVFLLFGCLRSSAFLNFAFCLLPFDFSIELRAMPLAPDCQRSACCSVPDNRDDVCHSDMHRRASMDSFSSRGMAIRQWFQAARSVRFTKRLPQWVRPAQRQREVRHGTVHHARSLHARVHQRRTG